MRILYHHRTTARDGSAVHINGLVDALRELGAEVRVVAPAGAAHSVSGSAAPSWSRRIRQQLPRAVHELAELGYNVGELARLRRAVDDFKPHLLYQRSNLYLLSGAHVVRRTGLPLIEEVNAPYVHERSRHGGIALGGLARWSERTALQQADAVIAVTQVLADMTEAIGVDRSRLHVMPNGIDAALLSDGAIDSAAKERLGLSGRLVLGFTGFVRDWNGLEGIVDQLARPEARSWFLLVVGDGPARAALELRAVGLGVADRLRFTGVLPRSEIAAHVSAFDIALQPAANPYASPLKLFEYLALGRAIVAPDQPNIREVLTPDVDAVLFASGDSSALCQAVLRLAADAQLRSKVAAGARQTVLRNNFTWRHNAQRVLEIAERLLVSREMSRRLPADRGGARAPL